MKIIGIYKITSPSNKIYIGQSVDIFKRITYYKNNTCEGQTLLHRSLKKYGWSKHRFEIICQCGKSDLDILERFYIELYQTFNSDFGLNLESGGKAGKKLCYGHKISAAKKGKKLSKEHRESMSLSRKGRKVSPEHRKKISLALKKAYAEGRMVFRPNRRTNSWYMKGRTPWNFGKKASIEQRLKMSISAKERFKIHEHPHSTRVYQYDVNGRLIFLYKNMANAALINGYSHSGISLCARGQMKHYKGFIWSTNELTPQDCFNILSKNRKQKTGRTVFQYDTNNKLLNEYISVSDAALKSGFDRKKISMCLNGEIISYKGFRWLRTQVGEERGF